MFKLINYVAQTVGKWTVGIRSKRSIQTDSLQLHSFPFFTILYKVGFV